VLYWFADHLLPPSQPALLPARASHAQVYSSMLDLLVKVWRQRGPAGYFQGLAPSLAAVVPALAVTVSTTA
jgi:hypothetical protein